MEFIVRYENQHFSNYFFSSQEILCISEIGLATDFPLQFSESMNEIYKLPYFEKGPIRENFVAMGSNEGLLLISKLGRPWYPSKKTLAKL
ncbi:hypothetical protein GNY06_01070 [Elizabethkingia argentiflava]|uniref:Uncharacterized protein n=1 Tax=Elizabethkingia argenteiflava TaxID=2681556 RepID=A0A845PNW7_9FLAO|nr:hypothetical protein [Elizabethkingia argenteiflava]NAW50039.1 hypothetical protein [Elizabethkingia argenteiflava]